MTDRHHGCFRGFVVLSEAYWAAHRTDPPEICLGFYHPDGGTTGEFCIAWKDIGGNHPLAPCLNVFSDAWETLWHFCDVLARLAALGGTRPSVDDVKAVLLRCGLKDRTERESPSPAAPQLPELHS